MEKLCKKCKLVRDTSFFRPNKSKKDGLQHYCIECDKEFQRAWYQCNKEEAKRKASAISREKHKVVKQFLIQQLEGKSCNTCGETDLLVLEFDHLKDKSFDIGQAHWKSEEELLEEISKCQILCANCHRRKTHEQMNTYKWRYSQEKRQESATL